VSRDRRAAALAVVLLAGLSQGCAGDGAEAEARRDPTDPFYTYGPILEAGRETMLELDIVRIPAQAGAETYMPRREMRVAEVFLVCWPTADWPADDVPQVAVHPLDAPADQRTALQPGAPSGDRLVYAAPPGAPVAADQAFVARGQAGPCEQVRFGVRGTMKTVLRDQPAEPDDKDAKDTKDVPDDKKAPDDAPPAAGKTDQKDDD
jgi:hypothetical protein